MNTAEAQKLEQSYHQVVAMYDMADKLIMSVVNSPKELQETHYELVNPLVLQLEESADILTEQFISIAEGKDTAAAHRTTVETAFRKVYAAMDDYQKRIGGVANTIIQSITPLFEQTKRHVEQVISVFIGFVELALDRIMQKNDLELIRKREEKVAEMLHSMSQSLSKST